MTFGKKSAASDEEIVNHSEDVRISAGEGKSGTSGHTDVPADEDQIAKIILDRQLSARQQVMCNVLCALIINKGGQPRATPSKLFDEAIEYTNKFMGNGE